MMNWYNHLRQLVARAAGPQHPTQVSRRRTVRPTLEGLERRWVLTGHPAKLTLFVGGCVGTEFAGHPFVIVRLPRKLNEIMPQHVGLVGRMDWAKLAAKHGQIRGAAEVILQHTLLTPGNVDIVLLDNVAIPSPGLYRFRVAFDRNITARTLEFEVQYKNCPGQGGLNGGGGVGMFG
jgi:hypothetical protein